MQKKQQKAVPNSQNIMATILASIPKEANVTKIDYEGPTDCACIQKLQDF